MTETKDIKETREAIARAKASAASMAASGPVPNKGTVHVHSVATHVATTGNGGNNPPLPPNKGGSGGSGSNGGFSGWWGKTHYTQKIGIWMLSAMIASSLLGALNIFWNTKAEEEENKNKLHKAETALAVAKLEAEMVAVKAKSSSLVQKNEQTTTKIQSSMPTVKASTFDCSTNEVMASNFAQIGTIFLPEGKQVLFKNGCAWIMIDRVMTTLQGSGYSVTFDPVGDPGARYCGDGKYGRKDSPETCLEFLKQHQGRKVRLEIEGESNAYFKLG